MIAENRILWLPTSEYEGRDWDYESGGYGANRNPSGVRVDADTALRSTVVLACVRVLASSVAGLPLHLYRRLDDGGKARASEVPLYRTIHERPNNWQTSYEWREQIMLHLLLHGNAYVEITGAGPTRQLIALHPSRMKVEQVESGSLRYVYREANGSQTTYTQSQIMHLRWLSDDGVNGMVPVELARDAIGLARACEIHGAAYFGNGARPGIVLATDSTLSADAAENLRNQWERMHRGADRSHRTAVLQGGIKPHEVGGSNMQESQFLETRRFSVEEICRIYGVPPHLVGDLTRSSFSNIEQQSLDFLTNGLVPWLRRIESAIGRDLITDDNLFAEFDTRGILRADAAGRASYYNTLWNLGVASVNEIRSWENMNPVDGGDTRFVQLNMTTLDKAAAEPEPVPSAVVEEIVVDPAAPSPADAEPQVAEVSLNGAQITGAIAIVSQVTAGVLTKDGAAAMLAAAFPSFSRPQIDAILAGVVEASPPQAADPAQPPQASVGDPAPAGSPAPRSLPQSRSLTISIDFDRTFAADPALWGEFAEDAAENGNTVVMISRRPDTPENHQAIRETLGPWARYFAQVMLVGDRLKDDAAREAGVEVDVWVDDSPQFVRAHEERAAPGTIVEGNWVTFDDGVVGKVDHVMTEGVLNLGDVEMPASPDAPVMLVSVWADGDFVRQVPVTMSDAELVEEPEDARGWKPKKPRRRKRGG